LLTGLDNNGNNFVVRKNALSSDFNQEQLFYTTVSVWLGPLSS